MTPKYAAILGNLGNTCDRFLSSGYKDQPSKETMFQRAASIGDVTGIELVGTWDIDQQNVQQIKGLLQDHDLQCVSIIPDHFSHKKWGQGSFTSADAAIRQEAVTTTQEMMDIAAELGCDLINLWPGQDGYDYPFQGDFNRAHDWWVEGIRACADYRTDIRLSLEYKIKEPRTHSYISRASDTLLLVRDIDRDTVGVTIDFGHALMAYENVAESAALLLRNQKLFHLHFNDNYRAWDDDMIVGSIHTVEYLEMLYWLAQGNYDGWFSMDLYPYREDAKEAIEESIAWLKTLHGRLEQCGMDTLTSLIQEGNATRSVRALRQILTGSLETSAQT